MTKMRGYPQFCFVRPIALAQIFFPLILISGETILYHGLQQIQTTSNSSFTWSVKRNLEEKRPPQYFTEPSFFSQTERKKEQSIVNIVLGARGVILMTSQSYLNFKLSHVSFDHALSAKLFQFDVLISLCSHGISKTRSQPMLRGLRFCREK